MDEQNGKAGQTEQAEQQEDDAQSRQEMLEQAKQRMHEQMTRGTLTLVKPIRAGGRDVTELKYDFSRLTGWEFADAMDMDAKGTNFFQLTRKQALCLFAATAGKETEKVDATDVRERLGIEDTMRAVEITMLFRNTSTSAARQDT